MNRHISGCIALLVLLCASVASAEFSIDAISPDVPAVGEGDLLLPSGGFPPPAVVFPAVAYGLVLGEELDAVSNGNDTICPAGNPNCFTIISWSVDRATVGVGGSVVQGQVFGNGAAGDIFQFEVSGTGVIIAPPSVYADAPTLDLTIVPESSIDALSTSRSPVLPLYFSIDPAAVPAAGLRWFMPGLSPADILLGPGPVPAIYATELAMGLQPGDDVDGVAIQDATPIGVFSAGDVVYVTLTAGSPSLTTIPASPGDIIQIAPVGPLVIYPAALMGLLPTDEMDALSMVDPPLGPPVPLLGTLGLIGLAAGFVAVGLVAIARRQRPIVGS